MMAAVPARSASMAIDADVGLVSDYRFRGVSLTDRYPALQGGATLIYKSFEVLAWASNIESSRGSDQEIDLAATVNHDISGFGVKATAVSYLYARNGDSNYFELAGSIEHDLNSLLITTSINYVPAQRGSGSRDNLYVSAHAGTDLGFAKLAAGIGHERGAFAPSGKWDWQVGFSHNFGQLRASANYVDTNRRILSRHDANLSGAGVVLALQALF